MPVHQCQDGIAIALATDARLLVSAEHHAKLATTDHASGSLAAGYGPTHREGLGLLSVAPTPDCLASAYPGDCGSGAADLASEPATSTACRATGVTRTPKTTLGTLRCLTMEPLRKCTPISCDDPVWTKAGTQIFSGDDAGWHGSASLVHTQTVPTALHHCAGGCRYDPQGLYAYKKNTAHCEEERK